MGINERREEEERAKGKLDISPLFSLLKAKSQYFIGHDV
jgi:hypothetical protein